jgi:hypothetical protein
MLTSCTPFAGPWQKLDDYRSKPVPGALNVGGARPQILFRCGPSGNLLFTGSGCDYVFTDSFGNKISVWSLLKELDSFAEQLPLLKPWMNKVEQRKDGRDFPYRMYLLTVSPAIVMLVPRTKEESFSLQSSCGRVIEAGCIQSQSFRGNNYWFQGEPFVRTGSSWFSLDKPGQIFPIDVSTGLISIASAQASLKLKAENGQWNVKREK